MTFIHVADIHASKARQEQTKNVLTNILSFIESNPVDYVLIAGDFWDSVITNTEASGFTAIKKYMKQLSEACKVVMIYGTPSHEPNGSLEIFKDFGIDVIDTITLLEKSDVDILCIPEPRRSNFISENQSNIDKAIKDYLSKITYYRKNQKPFVIMYHGELVGSFYQNGRTVQSPIALDKKTLQYCHADYIACGHIHDPQEVFENCYYSGSAYPINFGETHNAGFNYVCIDTKTTVKRVSFNFPTNLTLDLSDDDVEKLLKKTYENVNLKINLTFAGKQSKTNITALENKIKDSVNAHSCKILPLYTEVSNIRAKEICEQKTLREKVSTWGSVNNISISNNVLALAEDIENNMLIKYTSPKHSYRLLWASIRGAIGFSIPEREIDFEKYSTGVIVMVGANGSGKSTTLENLHPFPCMLTLPNKLRDYFNLADSHRILIYQDETGKKYRFSILIDGLHQSGTVKYFVETADNGKDWKAETSCDGTQASYSKYLEENFGSLEMFIRTSFFSDKETVGFSDIVKATKAERMNTFQKLAGNDYYIKLLDVVKTEVKDLTLKIKEAESFISSKETYQQTLEIAEKKVQEKTILLEDAKGELLKAKNDMKVLNNKNLEYNKYLTRKNSFKELSNEYYKQIENNTNTIQLIQKDKESYDFFIANREKIELYKQLTSEKSVVEKEILDLKCESAKCITKAYAISQITSKKELNKNNLQNRKNILLKDIENIELIIKNHNPNICPVCKATLSAEKAKEINKDILEQKQSLCDLKKEEQLLAPQIETISLDVQKDKDSINSYKEQQDNIDSQINVKETHYKNIVSSLDSLKDIEQLISFVPNYTNHEKNIEKLTVLNNDILSKIQKQGTLEPVEDPTADLELKEKEIQAIENVVSDLSGELQYSETEVATNTTLLKNIAEYEKNINKMKSTKANYDILATAFSNKGIPALELENIIPNIVSVANSILHSSYGDDLTIKFSSSRQGSTKIIEDFSLTVFNAKKNCDEPLICLSSGELVWIKQAISYASTVILHCNSGYGFETRFMDESDGHLDTEKKLKYMKMVNETHLEGNAYQTVLITHSQEIKEIAEQIIEL